MNLSHNRASTLREGAVLISRYALCILLITKQDPDNVVI